MASWYWECPICHNRVGRNDKDINNHKLKHPDNPYAFDNHLWEKQEERRKIYYGTRR